MGGELGAPAFKALIRHSKVLAENLTRQTEGRLWRWRAVPGAWDAPDPADRWSPRPGRAEVDTLSWRRFPPGEDAGSPAGVPRVSSRTWTQAGRSVSGQGAAALWLRRAVAARPGAPEPGRQNRGRRNRGAHDSRCSRAAGTRAQPDEPGPLAGCVRMRVRSRPSKPTAHLQPGNLVLSPVPTQLGTLSIHSPGRPQAPRSRLPLPRPPRPVHVAQPRTHRHTPARTCWKTRESTKCGHLKGRREHNGQERDWRCFGNVFLYYVDI